MLSERRTSGADGAAGEALVFDRFTRTSRLGLAALLAMLPLACAASDTAQIPDDVDPQSAEIVEGSTLDMDTSMLGGGLKVHNPRAVHECACGDSFSI